MLVQRAYTTELDLTDRQLTACKQHAGAARWAYNWGLQVKQERYRASKRNPTAIELHRELNALKKTAVPWMYQVSKCAPQEALWNLDAAINLEKLAGSSSDSQNACGAASSGARSGPRVKPAVMKQEPNTRSGLSRLG
jgi:transposase